jgi:electron transfer flavoprotein beta subunit
MNIVVTVKQIPDPNLAPALDGTRLKREGVAGVLDPGDEFGVEAGLQIASGHSGEVTVVSMGPAQAMEAVRKALSMGAAKGMLISDDGLQNSDALTTAKVLAEAIKKNGFDLVIAGVESTDGYTGVVPQMIAALLDVPMLTFAKSIDIADGTAKINRQTEKGYDIVECPLPCVITVTAGVNEPRYPSFKGIVEAKKKPVEQFTVGDLGVQLEGGSASQDVEGVNDAPTRGAGEVVQDDGTGATKIADFLAQAKVI